MELLQLPSIPILVFSFLFLLLLNKKRGFTNCRNESYPPRRPPGPWNLPFVGCMHHLVGQLPFRAFRELARKHGPLMLLRLGQVDVVVASSREAAEEILKNQSVTFASRPELLAAKIIGYGPTDIAWSPYGPHWRQLRKLCFMELFSARRIRSFSSIRTEETLDLMRDIARSGGTPVNLTEKLFGLSNAVVCRAAFGKRHKHRERFVPLIKDTLALFGGFCVADMFPSLKFIDVLSGAEFRLRRLRRRLDEILGDIIKEHEGKASASSGDKAGEVDDLVDVLLRLKDDPQLEVPLTMENVKGVIVDMFVAGTETSSTVVEWAMSELMRNPRSWRERRRKRGISCATEEQNRGERHLRAKLHEANHQGDAAASPAGHAVTETVQGDLRGHGIQDRRRHSRLRQRMGERQGCALLGRRRELQAREVPRQRHGFQGSRFRLLAVRGRAEDMPRNRVRDGHRGARPGSPPPALRLGAAPWNETGGARHVRDHGVCRTEEDGAEADRYHSSSYPHRYLKLSCWRIYY
ncbi:unnamed protein product [Musa acuminata subsp. burmannicoides]